MLPHSQSSAYYSAVLRSANPAEVVVGKKASDYLAVEVEGEAPDFEPGGALGGGMIGSDVEDDVSDAPIASPDVPLAPVDSVADCIASPVASQAGGEGDMIGSDAGSVASSSDSSSSSDSGRTWSHVQKCAEQWVHARLSELAPWSL